jgi:hypothetical protein
MPLDRAGPRLFTVLRVGRDVVDTPIAVCEPLGMAPERRCRVYAIVRSDTRAGEEILLAPPRTSPLGHWSAAL